MFAEHLKNTFECRVEHFSNPKNCTFVTFFLNKIGSDVYSETQTIVDRMLKQWTWNQRMDEMLFYGLRYYPARRSCRCILWANVDIAHTVKLLYFWKLYVTSVNFPPTLWACEQINNPKTTNGPESFHKHYNIVSFTLLVRILYIHQDVIEVQTETYLMINSINDNIIDFQRKVTLNI